MSVKLRQTLKDAIRNHRAMETPIGLRWHNTKEVDYEYIYNNFDKLTNADLHRLLKGTIYEVVVNAL
jgi:hypothetical protein